MTVPLRSRRLSPSGFSHHGFVRFEEQTYTCQVTNMSVTGAALTFAFALPVQLPDRFTLQLTLDGRISRACLIIWDDGTKVGVAFDEL